MNEYMTGDIIRGMSVNGKDVRLGDKIFAGGKVSVPKDTFVTFRSANGNIVETKTRVIFIVSNITGQGESYIQNRGRVRYSVIRKAVEFFNIYHNKFLAAVEGTVFEVSVDLENKEIEFTAEQGEVAVTREYKIKAGDEELEGLKEVVVISDRAGKRRSVRYDLDIEEAFEEFKNYDDVLAYFKEHLKKDEKEGERLEIVSTKNNIGKTLYRLARYDEAIKLFNSLYKEATALKNKGRIASVCNNLGEAWREKGEYDRAIGYFEKALDISLKVFGNIHLNIAAIYNNLGRAWDSKGEYDKAIDYHEKALNIGLKVFENMHPNIATFYNNLGKAFRRKGEYDRAIDYYEKALNIDLKVFGNEHPNVAREYNNLGAAWKSKGEYDRAIDYYEKALNIDLKVFGSMHPKIAIRYNNLGGAWYSKGEYDRAVEYYEKALKISKKFFGADHPHIKLVENNIKKLMDSKEETYPKPHLKKVGAHSSCFISTVSSGH
ncbi:MAG: tetratricopeptide repeat protein [Desulfobacterales bacterium]|nr:tetratricopeptide repeat protein [Desulfobacterales bacterium]